MPFFEESKQIKMGAVGWMDAPLEVDKTMLTTDDPKLLPPTSTASGSPSLTWRLTFGSRLPTCTETVSPPESTICANPVGRRDGDWLCNGVLDAEVDSNDGVGDSGGSIMLGEGLAICSDGTFDCETISLAKTLLVEGTLISETLSLLVSVGENGVLVEGEGVSLGTELGDSVEVSEGISWVVTEEDGNVVALQETVEVSERARIPEGVAVGVSVGGLETGIL